MNHLWRLAAGGGQKKRVLINTCRTFSSLPPPTPSASPGQRRDIFLPKAAPQRGSTTGNTAGTGSGSGVAAGSSAGNGNQSLAPRRMNRRFVQSPPPSRASPSSRAAPATGTNPAAAAAVASASAAASQRAADAAAATAAAASKAVATMLHWQVIEPPSTTQLSTVTPFQLHPAIAAVLYRRLSTPAPALTSTMTPALASTATATASTATVSGPEIQSFLSPQRTSLHSPFKLAGMERATKRIHAAIASGEKIVIHGDYDVDGVTGTAMLVRTLKLLNANVEWFIPNRLVDGYSFGPHSVSKVKDCNAKVVISVDSGTASFDTISQLVALGVDVIVTDHHEPPPDAALPPAIAILNPKLHGSTYPFNELCGGSVAFKLVEALCETAPNAAPTQFDIHLNECIALAAIATVCDVVPLRDENRVIAQIGFRAMAQTASPGLRALLDTAKCNPITADNVAFRIGPRLNASGRLGTAETAVNLFLTNSEAEGTRLAARLNELNEERKVIENGIKDQAIALAEEKYADPVTNPILVLAGTGWHLGVAGIVAARLVAQFQRPALCLSIEGDIARGSGRSIQDVSVLDILRAGDNGLLTRYGGHHAACGCEVPVSRIDELRVSLNAAARKLYPALATRRPPSPVADVKLPSGVKPLPYRHLYPPKICVDARISLSDLTPRFMRQFMALEPFGVGNRRPAFIATARVRSATLTRLEEHCKLVLSDQNGVDVRQIHGMCFHLGYRLPQIHAAARPDGLLYPLIDVVFTPTISIFSGRESIQLHVYDFVIHPTTASTATPNNAAAAAAL